MNLLTLPLLLTACCLLSTGCNRQVAIPQDGFHLTVERVITDNDLLVSVLKIRVSRDASISVDGDGFHTMVALTDSPADKAREGKVALSASRITRLGDDTAYIQTLIRPEAPHGFAGGPTIYLVPAATKLETYFSISATDGDYKLDIPIEIARLDNKPITMVVGKPTK